MNRLLIKKIFSVFTLLIVSNTIYSQDVYDVEATEQVVLIEMDFNKLIYPETEGNAYFSNDPKAALIGVVVPKKYADLISEMKKEKPTGIKNWKSGEFDKEGKKYFFYEGYVLVENNKELFMEVLVKSSNDNECIVVTSMFEPFVKEKFGKEGKRAIFSAKVLE